MDKEGCFVVVVGLILVLILGVKLGHNITEDHWKTECVERGVAEWKVSSNGKTEFKWRVEKEKTEE
jgi:hypothetical protein